MKPLAALQESLPLTATGQFEAVTIAEALGLDPVLLALLVRTGPLCFLDFEATGLDVESDALIEAGAALVRPDSDQVEIFNSFIRTDIPLSPFIKRLTGISQEDVSNAPTAAEVARALDDFIGDVPVVAHNARFEQTWLTKAVNPRFATASFLDTVDLLALVYPDARNMKLDTFCRAKLARKERHRALDDALDTLRVTVNLYGEARAGSTAPDNARRALEKFHPRSPWLERLVGLPDPLVTKSVAAGIEATPAADEAPPVPFDFEAICERLADVRLGGRAVEGYEVRPSQRELLRRVYDCFSGKSGKTVHICEAGTGIGKTLAYLAVAIPFARETGEQVIISTSSKLLQSQLIGKDLPAAARLLGYPDLRFTAMKGRANYLCKSRLRTFLDDRASEFPPPDSYSLAYVSAFSDSTAHGEVDRIPPVLFQMHADLERHRREVSSSDASECSRQTCETTRGRCVFRDARDRMEGADIIVVNHDLLLRWPPDYPALRHLIVDEVHELAERADGAYARSAEGLEILHRIDSALTRSDTTPALAAATVRELVDAARALVTAVGEEARELVGSMTWQSAFRNELAIPFDGPGPEWKQLIEFALELSQVLDALGHRFAEAADEDESPVSGAAEALVDAAAILKEAFPAPPTDSVVRFSGLARQNPNSWRLVATPVSPAADFQFEVLDRVETFFGTSATVSVGEDHRGALAGLELEERAAGRFRMDAPVESPFDYERNLRVLFVNEQTDASRLVSRTAMSLRTAGLALGGRTMGLFTSRDRLSTVADELDRHFSSVGITVIAPSTGNADPHDLVQTFVESGHAVLLGARAFWQGVDIPGDACQVLVIEKLPFDVPNDPLVQRRGELAEAAGGNSFVDYMLPRMLLRLKQMMGRLIRTPTDRGIVVVVEPRCDKRYFQKILDALPPRAPYRLIKLDDLQGEIDAFFTESGAGS